MPTNKEINNKDLEKVLGKIIREKVHLSLKNNGFIKEKTKKNSISSAGHKEKKEIIKEALVVSPISFNLKTEKLSKKTKDSHEALYKQCVEAFNNISAKLDTSNRQEVCNFHSLYRSLKIDECRNFNAVKLHELYFYNISDLASEISVGSIPYIKISRDFGSFENWQFDFMACALASRQGWAALVYEPYKQVYMNVCIDEYDKGIPVGCVPVLVLDVWDHAFFKDYDIDKKSYIVAMLREINWDVVEARMALAEKSELNALYDIRPIYNDTPEQMMTQAGQTEVQDMMGGGATTAPATPTPERVAEQDREERGY